MCPKKQFILIITLICHFAVGFSHNLTRESVVENSLRMAPLDSIESTIMQYYVVEDYSYAFDIVVGMINGENNGDLRERGVNLLATLAKSFTKQVIGKKVNIDDEKVKVLLKRFESEKYYIERPKISRFIKLMNYLCKGEYAYVHQKLIITAAYKIFLFFIFVYISIFFLSYSNKFNWKFEKKFRKFTLISFAILLLVFILFKNTCHNNIKDYSFYGISV